MVAVDSVTVVEAALAKGERGTEREGGTSGTSIIVKNKQPAKLGEGEGEGEAEERRGHATRRRSR